MKIVRLICCGMDVHKDIIFTTIATSNSNNVTTYIQKQFSTLNFDLINLLNWLIDHNCYDVCMESTGKYWIPIFNILEEKLNVFLTHPKYVKAIKGKKTDKKDSKWIADIFKHDLLKLTFILPKEIRQLREIARYRYKLVCMRSSERNRYQNCMTVSNIGLASTFSDVMGKSCKSIIDQIIKSDCLDDEKITKLIHGKCKNKVDKILDAIHHSKIESDQHFKLDIAMQHMDKLDQFIQSCECELLKRCSSFIDKVTHITQLPGIALISSMIIISEIGYDVSQFDSDKSLTSWAGLSPANNESAGKKKSVRISKAGQYLKPLLIQCALAAITNKKEIYFGIKYNRIKEHRGHKKAIIAIARMMLISIYYMLLTGEAFNPSDYESLKSNQTNKKVVLTVDTALKYLESLGVDIETIKIPQTE